MKFKPLKTFSIAVVLIYFYGVPILYKYNSEKMIEFAAAGLVIIGAISAVDALWVYEFGENE